MPAYGSDKPDRSAEDLAKRYSHAPVRGKKHKLVQRRKRSSKAGTTARRSGPVGRPTQGQVDRAQGRRVDPLKAQVDALVALRYGGEEAALGQRQQNIGAWFPQYQQRIAQAQTAQQAYFKGQQDALGAQAAQAAQGPNLGPGVSADVQAQSQLAGASRQALVGSLGGTIGAVGGVENAFLANQGVVGGAAQLQQQMLTGQAQQQLGREKGQYGVQARGELQDAQHKQALEDAAFGLNQQKEANDLAIAGQSSKDKAAQRRATSRNQRSQQRSTSKQREADRASRERIAQQRERIAQQRQQTADTKAHGKAQQAHRKTSNKAIDRIDTAKNDYNRLANTAVQEDLGGGKTRTRKPTRDEVIARLRSEGFSANEIHLALKNEWDDADVRMAHRLGIIVSDSGRKRKLKRRASGASGYGKGGGRPD